MAAYMRSSNGEPVPVLSPQNVGEKKKHPRRGIAAAIGVMTLAGAVAGAWLSGIGSHAQQTPKHWMLPEYAASLLSRTATGGEFIRSIDNASTYEILSAHTGPDVLPQATHVEAFGSYQAIRTAFSDSRIPGNVKVILYDNERWASTPPAEQQQPSFYVRLAEQLVHSRGLQFMNAPAPDLNTTLEGNKHYDNYQGYLHLKLGALAAYADIFDIQAQRAGGVNAYTSFVQHAAIQARDANKAATVLCGITTAVSTSRDLTNEIRSTTNICDGYWLNVIGGDTGVATAIPMLQSIYPALDHAGLSNPR